MRLCPLLSCLAALLLCVLPVPSAADYVVSSLHETAYGWEGSLKLSTPAPYGNDISALRLSVWFETSERLRVTLRDANARRWEIPADFLHIESRQPPQSAPPSALYEFSFTSQPFGFAISRRSTGAVLFNTSGQPLFFSNQFLQLGTALPPNANMYGLGERIAPFRLPQKDYTIWDTDWGNPTVLPLYGHHPVYHRVEDTGDAHAVVFWNSNMMDINLTSSHLTYKSIGGILDFYFLLGPAPLALTTQYTDIVGRPWMPPMWSMGWHQCKWGYSSANYTLQVALNYSANDIPLDVIWNDIDWMRDYVAFTYNDELGSGGYTAKDVRALNEHLTANSQYHVQIVDPNIPVVLVDKDKQPYLPYINGKAAELFVRHPANDTFLFGLQWPAVTVVWPDWTHPAIEGWWEENFRRFGQIAGQLAGVWLDMNEPSNFCDGQISDRCHGLADSSRQLDPIAVPHPPASSPTDIPMPPYEPYLSNTHRIQSGSFNISSHLYLGQSYNVKDFWGMMEQRATATAMASIHNARPFTLSRSSFMGSGSWGAHWLGDNNSDWDNLRRSIAEVLSMGLYGITMVGADICGFGGNTNAELCARWIQLGSLYPFSRDHSTIGSTDQEAYRFGEPYVSINRNSIKLRYSLLPYIYQLFVDSHLYGYPVWRALMQVFPRDSATYAIDSQFMLGDALMGIPIMEEGQDGVDGYLPNQDWFNYFTYTRLTTYNASSMVGQNVSFCSTLDDTAHVPLIQRGGYTVFTQRPKLTTAETAKQPLTMQVALDWTGASVGHLARDDGLSLGNIDARQYNAFTATARLNITGGGATVTGFVDYTAQHLAPEYDISQLFVERVVILGGDVSDSQPLSSLPAPTLTVAGRQVALSGLQMQVVNGAIVLEDSSVSLLPAGQNWQLVWPATVQSPAQRPVSTGSKIPTVVSE